MENTADVSKSNSMLKTMQGKVVVITGATSGIGAVTAQALAEKGAKVAVIGRNLERTNETVEKIKRATGNQEVKSFIADLSSLKQIQLLCEQILAHYDRLDILINNAGANYFRRRLSPDGYELTFALNHLSYFYLTQILLGLIQSTADKMGEARIINVASEAHRYGKIDFNDIMFERRVYEFGGWRAYAQSKLANILFTFELARRLSGSQVSTNAVHPGLVATKIGQDNGRSAKLIMKILLQFAISPQEGAQTTIFLASWPELKGRSGKYYSRCQAIHANQTAYRLDDAQKLWALSEELTSNSS